MFSTELISGIAVFELYAGQVSPFVNTVFQCVSAFGGDFKCWYGTSQVAPPCCKVATVARLLLVRPFPSHGSRGISQSQRPPRSCRRGWDGTLALQESRSWAGEAAGRRVGGFLCISDGKRAPVLWALWFWACGVREPSLLAASYSCQISK